MGGSSAGGYDAFVRKYSPDGVERWTRQFGTTAFAVANGVAADASGHFVVVGRTGPALPGSNGDEWDAFLRKYRP